MGRRARRRTDRRSPGRSYAGKGVGGWTQDAAMTPIRNLYPVEFPSRLAAMESNIYAARSRGRWISPAKGWRPTSSGWPTRPPPAGRPGRRFPASTAICPVRGPKPGATVYARFSDPAHGPRRPAAGLFRRAVLRAGSVFYMGSGEMWRLRAVDETYFEQFYTKLIRHVSQGRLLRGSSRGVLLVGQDRYMLGNTVEVRAQLTNARLEPLDAPSVNLQVIQPDGAAQTVVVAGRSEPAGRLPRAISRPCRKAPTAWNCPCPKARTNGSAAASK